MIHDYSTHIQQSTLTEIISHFEERPFKPALMQSDLFPYDDNSFQM